MDLSDLINPQDISVSLRSSCRKELLHDLSDIAAKKTGLNGQEIFQTLLEREKLGSTGVGNGIAIPHGKLPGLSKITGLVAFLDKPIDFDAMDDQPVDVVFLLLAPETGGADHLKALARVARVLREPGMLQKLRDANDPQSVFDLLTMPQTSHAA
ncbi:MAG: PTS IIA-like nitrogen regulatory protein PtsN [Salaquimonas sp.]